MMERVSLLIDESQGALMRVIGTIERRGWRVQALAMAREGNRGCRLELEVARLPWHRGDLAVLVRHLEKLIPVETVDCNTRGAAPWADQAADQAMVPAAAGAGA
ncbi:MAG: ACT domain-containing protein [Rhodothalassiaceae bacterium]